MVAVLVLFVASGAVAVGVEHGRDPATELETWQWHGNRPSFTFNRSSRISPAPDFSLQDLDDGIQRFSHLRGRPVIVDFWATWCPPFQEEMATM